MPDNTTSITKTLQDRLNGNRTVWLGIAVILLILVVASLVLFFNLPDANAFNDRVEKLFIENDNLTSGAEIKLLEILAQSGTAFSDALASYRFVIFVLFVFSASILVAALVFLMNTVGLNKRMTEVERAGIHINSLIVSRDERVVYINNIEFSLTDSACEALSVLCEARLDDEVISGIDLEAMITGKSSADCDEAAGATRIKRLRDHLGNQFMSELLIKTISRKGYILSIDKDVIQMI